MNATTAIVKVDNSPSGAVYDGLAISASTTTASPMIYAANFHSGAIDVFDTNYAAVSLPGAFTDPAVPAGFAPFNIQNLGGKLYVTYAKQDAAKKLDVAGVGNGYVSVYDLNGNLLQHLVSGGPLNSPWGVALAPVNFGAFAGDLIVDNFGDGYLNAFDPGTGAAVGTLQDQNGNPIKLPGLWGLFFGNGGNGGDVNALYFASWPGRPEARPLRKPSGGARHHHQFGDERGLLPARHGPEHLDCHYRRQHGGHHAAVECQRHQERPTPHHARWSDRHGEEASRPTFPTSAPSRSTR